MDIGVHELRIAVTAGDPPAVRSILPGVAERMGARPLVFAHLPEGIPGPSGQDGEIRTPFLTLSEGRVAMLCSKRSWDGDALVLRLQESSGAAAACDLRLSVPALNAELTFKPFEIKTLRVERSGAWREVSLIDES